MAVDEVVKEIILIVNTLGEQEMGSLSGDTLSRLVLKLASYKASLGEPIADAFRAALDAEAEYYAARAVAYQSLRDDGKGSTDAGEMKHALVKDSFLAWNAAKHAHKLLAQLSTDCHDLIEAIRGRLINLQQEMRESHAG